VEESTTTTSTTKTSASPSGGRQPTSTTTTVPPQASSGQAPEKKDFVRAAAPRCVEIGKTFVVKVTTASRALIGVAMAYADGQGHETYTTGEADAQGLFEATMTVPVDAPLGDARVYVTAGDGYGRGTTGLLVTVVERGGRCTV
jgi:hypothetical protein